MSQGQDIIMKFQENQQNNRFMLVALEEARKAAKKNEVPVGAVVVYKDKIIARAHNLREKKQSFYAHAEFLAMIKAQKKLKSWRLSDCDIYVTMEPCPMCAGAMIQARIRNLYYGVDDNKTGAVTSVLNLLDYKFNHKITYENNMMSKESEELIKKFFAKIRGQKK